MKVAIENLVPYIKYQPYLASFLLVFSPKDPEKDTHFHHSVKLATQHSLGKQQKAKFCTPVLEYL